MGGRFLERVRDRDSLWSRRFGNRTPMRGKMVSSPHPCRVSLVPTNSLVKWVLETFRKVNRPRLCLDQPPQLALSLRMNRAKPLFPTVLRRLVPGSFLNL